MIANEHSSPVSPWNDLSSMNYGFCPADLRRCRFGKAQVTRHVGVPSWGQRRRNLFTRLFSYTYYHIHNPHTFPRLVSVRLVSGPFSLSHPPAPTLPPLFRSPPTQSQPGRGGSVEGVHPPSPSTFAPWSSRPRVVCFCAPHRLPDSLKYHIFMCGCTNSRKISVRHQRQCAVLWRNPSFMSR